MKAGSTAPPDALYTLSISFYNRHRDKDKHGRENEVIYWGSDNVHANKKEVGIHICHR